MLGVQQAQENVGGSTAKTRTFREIHQQMLELLSNGQLCHKQQLEHALYDRRSHVIGQKHRQCFGGF